MSKSLTETTISTPNSRLKLGAGLYWRALDRDVHLGYRKGKRAGNWLVRWYLEAGKYRHEPLGSADDALTADGSTVLSFAQAIAKARHTVEEHRANALVAAAGPVPTIRSVVESYMASRDAREVGRGSASPRSDARRRLTRHVLSSPIADKALHTLKDADLTDWRDKLPNTLAKSTVRRLSNDFKAALNAGAAKHRASMPADLQNTIKVGLSSIGASAPVARDKQALSDADVRRIVNAAAEVDERDQWEGDLARLIIVLAATGARFSQVARMQVGDLQADQVRLMVPVSAKGRGTKAKTHVAVRVGPDVVDALRAATVGRRRTEPLLERWRHKQVPGKDGKSPRWERDTRGPWRYSTEMAKAWAAIVSVAGLPAATVAYSLRHSSIVRQLKAMLPVKLVADLHDTSIRMIEAHYGAAIVDALDELAAGAVIPLVGDKEKKVVPLRAGASTNPQG